MTVLRLSLHAPEFSDDNLVTPITFDTCSSIDSSSSPASSVKANCSRALLCAVWLDLHAHTCLALGCVAAANRECALAGRGAGPTPTVDAALFAAAARARPSGCSSPPDPQSASVGSRPPGWTPRAAR
eukprot:789673-Prymnesium_polylepis.1